MRAIYRQRSAINRRPNAATHSRAGFSIVELITAGLLLGAVFALAVPTLRWIGLEQRAAEHRQLAILEVSNLMDRLTSESWDTLTADYAKSVALADSAAQQLPQPELKITIDSNPDSPEAKRIMIQLAWKDRAGKSTSPIRATSWVYRGRANG